MDVQVLHLQTVFSKLTWLVLGGDPAARSHRVEQSLHSEACNTLGASDGVIHSSISLEVISFRAITNFFSVFEE